MDRRRDERVLNSEEKKNGHRRANKFEVLFDEINDSLFLHDFEGNIKKVNKVACERLGFSKAELNEKRIYELGSGYNYSDFKALVQKLLQVGTDCFETIYTSSDNVKLCVEVYSKTVRLGSTQYILTCARDITKRKTFEKKLVLSEKIATENEVELRQIFDKAPAAIVLIDEKTRIHRINQKGLTDLNLSDEWIIGKKLQYVLKCFQKGEQNVKCGTSADCAKCKFLSVLNKTIQQKAEIDKEEISIKFKCDDSNAEKTFLVSTSILNKGKKEYYLITIDNITERKLIENELKASKIKAEESDRLKSAFMHNLSHEIRTPLNSIIGFLEFVTDETGIFSVEEKKQFSDMMRKSGEKLVNTVTDLVEVSRIDSGVMIIREKEVSLDDLINEYVEKNEARFQSQDVLFSVERDAKTNNITFATDKSKVFQILNNLLDNALKFTSKGTISLSVSKNSSSIIFSIKDTGMGIPQHEWFEIFEPFRQSNSLVGKDSEGVGLGLTITKKIVERLNGTIWLNSEVGVGTSFYFTLPLKQN